MNQVDRDTIELLEEKITKLKFSYKAIGEVKQILLAMLGLIKKSVSSS